MNEQLSQTDFQFIQTFVRNKSAIIIESHKAYLVESRLVPLLSEMKLPSFTELVQTIRKSPDGYAANKVINAMTTNETSFFRDTHPFETLKNVVLPKVIEKRQNEKTIRIWCAAASSGQEPYTIAMMIREHFVPKLPNWKISILGTDLSDDVLSKAKNGLYSQFEVNRGLPAPYLVKYFKRSGTEWQINPEIKSMVEYRPLNLLGEAKHIYKFDIVFIRNVLIYFDNDIKKQILTKVHRSLATDGYLFIGATENIFSLNLPFERVQSTNSIYYLPQSNSGVSK